MDNIKRCNKAPTEKQIEVAEAIARTLHINFPQSSKEFTRYTYWHFISTYIEEAKAIWMDDGCYGDMWDEEMAWFSPLNQ